MPATRANLKIVPLFSDLSEAELDLVLAASRVVFYPKANVVFNEGDPGDSLFVLVSGRVKVVLLGTGGKETILAMLGTPGFFGELALLDGAPRSATVVTLAKCEFLRIPRQPFLELLAARPAVLFKVVAHLTRYIRDATDQIRSLSMFDSYEKTLRCLLKLATQENVDDRKSLVVVRPRPPHQELAHMIGCKRETVSRALTVLQDAGYVSPIEDGFVIEELALKRYLKPNL
jgi:CRP/FNR family transcriptional regulator, cyclic AMP receptor protein